MFKNANVRYLVEPVANMKHFEHSGIDVDKNFQNGDRTKSLSLPHKAQSTSYLPPTLGWTRMKSHTSMLGTLIVDNLPLSSPIFKKNLYGKFWENVSNFSLL